MSNRKTRRASAAREHKTETAPPPRQVTPDVVFACRTFAAATPNAQITLIALGKIADALSGFKPADIQQIVATIANMSGLAVVESRQARPQPTPPEQPKGK